MNIFYLEFTFNIDDLSDTSFKIIDEPVIKEDSIYYIYKSGGISKAIVKNMSDIKSNSMPNYTDEYNVNGGKCRTLFMAFCYDNKLKSANRKKKLVKNICTKEYKKLLKSYMRILTNKSNYLETWIHN